MYYMKPINAVFVKNSLAKLLGANIVKLYIVKTVHFLIKIMIGHPSVNLK